MSGPSRPTFPGRCRHCPSLVEWARTEKGARMPLEPGLDPEGNVVFRDGKAHVLTAEEDVFYVGPRYMTHWAKCDNPPARRKK